MTDLTKITTPFGLLDAETQEALRAHQASGGWVQLYWNGTWRKVKHPALTWHCTYRAAPEPLRPMTIPWDVLQPQWKWAARNRCGVLSLFTDRPVSDVITWYAREGWSNAIDGVLAGFDPGTVDWKDSLQERPS